MKWDENKIQKLKSLRKKGFTHIQIAKKLDTTKNSVKMKICKLGKFGQLQLRDCIQDDTFTFDYVDKETLLKALMILLCEGTKYIPNGNRNRVEIVNSDPRIIYLFVDFLRKLKVNENKIKLRLKIPKEEERRTKMFWSKLLNIPHTSFDTSARPVGLKANKKSKYGTLTVKYNSKMLAYELSKMADSIIELKKLD